MPHLMRCNAPLLVGATGPGRPKTITMKYLTLLLFLFAFGCAPDAPNPETPEPEVEVETPVPTDVIPDPAADTLEAEVEVETPVPTDVVPTPAPKPAGTGNYYEISTPLGKMVVRLYDETPKHRDNFKKLVAEGYYNGTTFHRIIPGFMIQGGDPNSKDNDLFNDGKGDPGYTIPAEIVPKYFHKRGALSTARLGDQMNPERASSGSQFYVVHGTNVIDDAMLDTIEQKMKTEIPDPNFTYSPEARKAYTTNGGALTLDRMYTVFGEVVDGFDTLDKIATTRTMRTSGQQVHPAVADQPMEKVTMSIRALPNYSPPAP